jgi:V/A-type H+-transporting ATPase subunit A
VDEVIQNPALEKVSRARYTPEADFPSYLEQALAEIAASFKQTA